MNLLAGQQWGHRIAADLWTEWVKERMGQIETGALKHIYYHM